MKINFEFGSDGSLSPIGTVIGSIIAVICGSIVGGVLALYYNHLIRQ